MLRKGHLMFLGSVVLGTLMIVLLTRPDMSALKLLTDMDSEKRVEVVMPDAPKSSKTFEDIKGVSQEDPSLIQHLRGSVIHRPAKGAYRLNKPELKDFSQFGQPLIANDLVFHGKRNGFFIEVGALNGEYCSNSLFYERELGWNGLLIEPNYDTYSQLMRKRRKAYTVHGAVSSAKSVTEVIMENRGFGGEGTRMSRNGKGMTIKAYPLYSLLLAINVTTIDYFSLDVEGQELQVLQTLPHDKIKFMLLHVEATYTPLKNLRKFLEPLGYKFLGTLDYDGWFVHPNVWKEGMRV